MLTIEDIRNPKRSSGFDHVAATRSGAGTKNLHTFKVKYRANVYGGRADKAGREWEGPCRHKPEEAAQDYCDYMNAKTAALTVADLKDPSLRSGYKHVGFDPKPGIRRPYHAQVYGGKNNKAGHAWQGPSRVTGEEAAQDYIDYVQQNGVQSAPRLKSAGHTGRRTPMTDPEVQHALGVLRDAKAQREGRQGYVYLIVEDHPSGAPLYGKIGYSTNPEARVAELQTGNPRPLRLLAKFEGTQADESALHIKYIHYNTLQEWFGLNRDILAEFGVTVESLVPGLRKAA